VQKEFKIMTTSRGNRNIVPFPRFLFGCGPVCLPNSFVYFAFISWILLFSPLFQNTGFAENYPPELLRRVDRDGDRVADRLFTAGDKCERVPILITLARSGVEAVLQYIMRNGGVIMRNIEGRHTVISARFDNCLLQELTARFSEQIVLVEYNPRVTSSLLWAARGAGFRRAVVPPFKPPDPKFTVAVLDSGIDDEHPAFAGLVRDWQDFVGATAEDKNGDPVLGDLYDEAVDFSGHGTHVASLISGLADKKGSYTISLPYYYDGGLLPLYGFVRTANGGPLMMNLYFEGEDRRVNVALSGAGGENVQNYRGGFGEATLEISPSTDPEPVLAELSSATEGYVNIALTLPFDRYSDDIAVLAGAAPRVGIAAYKVLDDYNAARLDTLLAGFLRVREQVGALNIVAANASLEINSLHNATGVAARSAIVGLIDAGVVVVIAAGNHKGGDGVIDPDGSLAAIPEALVVGATTYYDRLSSFTQVCGENCGVAKPDVLAPGGSIIDKVGIIGAETNHGDYALPEKGGGLTGPDEDFFPDDYTVHYGTSQSTAFVSGLVALLAAYVAEDDLSPGDRARLIKAVICQTATEVGAGEEGGPDPGPPGRSAQPKDGYEGFGRINADAAVEALALQLEPGQEVSEHLGGETEQRRAFARALQTVDGLKYSLKLVGDAALDADLYIYKRQADQYGEPIAVSASDAVGSSPEQVSFIADGRYIAVVKRVEGEGQARLFLDQPTQDGQRGCAVSGSGANLSSAAVILFIGFAVFIRRIWNRSNKESIPSAN
jgi:subtilisin family serine protease